jgi:hypothetical protein
MTEKFDKKTYEIFGGKQIQNVFEDIYNNSTTKKDQIYSLINELRTLIKTLPDATIVVPLIAQYLEISVRNDEHLIKLVEVVQRLIKADRAGDDGPGGIGDIMSDEEQDKLLEDALDYTDLQRQVAKAEAERLVKLEIKKEAMIKKGTF